ncbi:MAG: hypothetical protein KC496_09465 [Anaerolineae bacterium]|nr:hypothetical protein [Anaerolineae bacterium]
MEEHFSYRPRGDGIHEFHLKMATTQAIEEWLYCMGQIIDQGDMLQRIIVILPDDFLPPIRYSLREIRLWMQRYPHTAQDTQTAVLLPYGKGLRAIVQTFNHTLTRGQVGRAGFFFHGEYDAAVAWLLAET